MAVGHRHAPALAVLDSVRCLECGEIYARPATGGGGEEVCPLCAYAGWIPVSVPGELRAPHRSAADPPPGPLARRR